MALASRASMAASLLATSDSSSEICSSFSFIVAAFFLRFSWSLEREDEEPLWALWAAWGWWGGVSKGAYV